MKLLILAALISGVAFADNDKAEALRASCQKQGGVFSQVDNDIVRAYTCRTMKGDLVGVYMPEQTFVLSSGDSDLFEKSIKWGKKL